LHHLQQSLPLIARHSFIKVIVVDYDCPQGTAQWVKENFPQVKLVQVTDEPGWNLSRARNLGAKAAATPWLLFMDADALASDKLGDWVQQHLHAENAVYLHGQVGRGDLSGTFFCARTSFESIGGYDEAFTGYGGEDDDIYYRLIQLGQQTVFYPDDLFGSIPHPDAERLLHYPKSSKGEAIMANLLYRHMKYDLAGILSQDSSLETRTFLRKLATESVKNLAASPDQPSELFLNLGARTELGRLLEWDIERRIVYKITRRSPK
jgi:glycosyltransferase involved in cell wall biosynthesis